MFYTYGQFLERINGIRENVKTIIPSDCQNVGIVVCDSIDTYASIFALWFEGKTYVPILPSAPEERNNQVIDEAGLSYILNVGKLNQNLKAEIISTKLIESSSEERPLLNLDENKMHIFYLLQEAQENQREFR